jgi:hypothetical protein
MDESMQVILLLIGVAILICFGFVLVSLPDRNPPRAIPPAVQDEIATAKRHLAAQEYRSAVRDMRPVFQQSMRDRFDQAIGTPPGAAFNEITMEQRFQEAVRQNVIAQMEVHDLKKWWALCHDATDRLVPIDEPAAKDLILGVEQLARKLYQVV